MRMVSLLSFQSIGVTKDWRLTFTREGEASFDAFPINRRHQGLATLAKYSMKMTRPSLFPINRRHQGLATTTVMEAPIDRVVFPINMRRQRMATCFFAKTLAEVSERFPINRRHQGLATATLTGPSLFGPRRFQSIGVTKDWRLQWIPCFKKKLPKSFPINRRHQELATPYRHSYPTRWR